MEIRYRKAQGSQQSPDGLNIFCVSRILANFALVNVKAVADLRSASKLMCRIASRIPGSYILFNRKTRQVLSRAVSHKQT
jgi:hypothetical protein